MNRFKEKLAQLMQGRYGIDALYKALIAGYFALFVLNLVFRQTILMYLGTALAVFAFYRVFSKQHAKRAAENRKYLSLYGNLRKKALLTVNRVKFYKTHRYRACPSCRTMLKLEKKIGTMTVNCPKCRNTFQMTVRR